MIISELEFWKNVKINCENHSYFGSVCIIPENKNKTNNCKNCCMQESETVCTLVKKYGIIMGNRPKMLKLANDFLNEEEQ